MGKHGAAFEKLAASIGKWYQDEFSDFPADELIMVSLEKAIGLTLLIKGLSTVFVSAVGVVLMPFDGVTSELFAIHSTLAIAVDQPCLASTSHRGTIYEMRRT